MEEKCFCQKSAKLDLKRFDYEANCYQGSMLVLYSAINHILFGIFPWSTDNSPILTKIA